MFKNRLERFDAIGDNIGSSPVPPSLCYFCATSMLLSFTLGERILDSRLYEAPGMWCAYALEDEICRAFFFLAELNEYDKRPTASSTRNKFLARGPSNAHRP